MTVSKRREIEGMKIMCAGRHQEGSTRHGPMDLCYCYCALYFSHMWASQFENNHSHSPVYVSVFWYIFLSTGRVVTVFPRRKIKRWEKELRRKVEESVQRRWKVLPRKGKGEALNKKMYKNQVRNIIKSLRFALVAFASFLCL